MNDDLEHYRWLQTTLTRTQLRTDRAILGLAQRWPRAIECMFKQAKFFAPQDANEITIYEQWAFRAFISAAQSFFAAHELIRAGLYVEAEIIHRHLLEVLAQLNFFATRHHEAEKHLLAGAGLQPQGVSNAVNPGSTGDGQRVKKPGPRQFRQIFDAVAPGYYDAHYSTHSNIAHGGLVASAYRFGAANEVVPGCEYDEASAAIVINKVSSLLYGYIQQARRSFPAAKLDTSTSALVVRVTQELDEMLVPDPGTDSGFQTWLDLIGPLIHRPANSV